MLRIVVAATSGAIEVIASDILLSLCCVSVKVEKDELRFTIYLFPGDW